MHYESTLQQHEGKAKSTISLNSKELNFRKKPTYLARHCRWYPAVMRYIWTIMQTTSPSNWKNHQPSKLFEPWALTCHWSIDLSVALTTANVRTRGQCSVQEGMKAW